MDMRKTSTSFPTSAEKALKSSIVWRSGTDATVLPIAAFTSTTSAFFSPPASIDALITIALSTAFEIHESCDSGAKPAVNCRPRATRPTADTHPAILPYSKYPRLPPMTRPPGSIHQSMPVTGEDTIAKSAIQEKVFARDSGLCIPASC